MTPEDEAVKGQAVVDAPTVAKQSYSRTLVAAGGALLVLAFSMDTGNGSHHQTCEAGISLYSYDYSIQVRAMKPEGRKKVMRCTLPFWHVCLNEVIVLNHFIHGCYLRYILSKQRISMYIFQP